MVTLVLVLQHSIEKHSISFVSVYFSMILRFPIIKSGVSTSLNGKLCIYPNIALTCQQNWICTTACGWKVTGGIPDTHLTRSAAVGEQVWPRFLLWQLWLLPPYETNLLRTWAQLPVTQKCVTNRRCYTAKHCAITICKVLIKFQHLSDNYWWLKFEPANKNMGQFPQKWKMNLSV